MANCTQLWSSCTHHILCMSCLSNRRLDVLAAGKKKGNQSWQTHFPLPFLINTGMQHLFDLYKDLLMWLTEPTYPANVFSKINSSWDPLVIWESVEFFCNHLVDLQFTGTAERISICKSKPGNSSKETPQTLTMHCGCFMLLFIDISRFLNIHQNRYCQTSTFG